MDKKSQSKIMKYGAIGALVGAGIFAVNQGFVFGEAMAYYAIEGAVLVLAIDYIGKKLFKSKWSS